jgi:ABC-type sugar transport system ATPase subunit
VTPDQSEAMAMADRILVLDRGKVVQVGAPVEVYDKPTSKFVATFIGTPPMNIISCSIRRNGAYSLIVHPRFNAAIDTDEDILRTDSERPILLGLRPSDIHVIPNGSEGSNVTLMAKVMDAEEFGHRALIEFDVGGVESIRGLVPGFNKLRIGDNTKIRLDLARAHLIDPQTSRVLIHGPF